MFNWIKRHITEFTFSEEQAVLNVQNGNTQEFGKLYLKYIDQIYRYIFFRVNQDRPTAEDITETVFIKALQKIELFDKTKGSFKTWLYGIAHNLVIDFYRSQKFEIDIDKATQIGEQQTMEDTFDHKQKIESIKEALHFLTPEQRDVVMMRFVDDMSHHEIAETMGKNIEAIRAIQYRALKILRRKFTYGQ